MTLNTYERHELQSRYILAEKDVQSCTFYPYLLKFIPMSHKTEKSQAEKAEVRPGEKLGLTVQVKWLFTRIG